MRRLLLATLVALIASGASAKEYGNYDPQRLLATSETPAGKKYGFDIAYLDQILNDLATHAKNYPPQFDTPEDKQRATRDVVASSKLLDILINAPAPNPELLLRAGFLNSLGHNLDISGSASKADSIFKKLLAATPSDPRGNYMYGNFLAGSNRPREALPYLDKALSVGVVDAAYSIGMTYLTLGDKEHALKNFEDYKRRRPGDANVDKIIEAIRNGKVEFKYQPGPASETTKGSDGSKSN